MTEQKPEDIKQPEPLYIPERALLIVAHADDIEFGASGTVARLTAAGTQVTYCIVSDNSSGDNDKGADLEALKRTRVEEQIASAKVVGVEDVRFLNYPDGVITPTLELRRDLTRVIRDVRPQLVITMDPTTILARDNYINHPDHRAVGEAATYAVFPSAGSRPIFPELLEEGLEPYNVHRVWFTIASKPNLYVDISETIDKKEEALRFHKSQFRDRVDEIIDMIKKWNREAGEEINAEYAEVYRQMIFVNEEDDKDEEVIEMAESGLMKGN